tara:strand:- start:291 stop:569 length:279 start_codon:yes stop_codon:yes gene_type:complete
MIKKLFRMVSFLEGTSYLLLLFIAVPYKYYFDNEQYVKLLGMPHGILFLIYIFLTLVLNKYNNWEVGKLFIILSASIIPFGTFYVDKKYLQD